MSTNMTLITSVTVGSGGAASVTLPATGTIPATYTDLKVVFSVRCDQAVTANSLGINFNSSSTGYYYKSVYGNGASVVNDQASNYSKAYCGDYVGTSATSNTFSNIEIYIPNYAGSNAKSFSCDSVSENNGTTARANIIAGLWDNSAAITSLVIAPFSGTGNFVEGSTFYLYGISNVTSTTKATGGIVSSDGTYNYHMFPYSGTFTPTESISADVLVIGGGGTGGIDGGGGGGAGGVIYFASQSLTTTGYSVIVGAGGSCGAGFTNNNGNNSSFGALTAAVGGGFGGQGNINNAATGGSGGGGGAQGSQPGAASTQTLGTATDKYGFAGGAGVGSAGGGGGGGAGGAGSSGASGAGGAGGVGTSVFNVWGSATSTGQNSGGTYYYAGGGSGGTGYSAVAVSGGLGGGGAGGGGNGSTANITNPTAGTANTGGGGGGGNGNPATGSNGGSGLVIIRYAI